MSETPVSSNPVPTRSPRSGLAVGIGIAALMLLAVGGLLIANLASNRAASPSPAPTAVARPPAQPVSVTILHTNDTWGYLLPCG